jgi:hypothetical protein
MMPYSSQDVVDRIEPLTKDSPIVGFLNFRLSGISVEEIKRKENVMKLVCFDDHDVEYPPIFIRYEGEETKDTELIHIPGLREVEVPSETPTPAAKPNPKQSRIKQRP